MTRLDKFFSDIGRVAGTIRADSSGSGSAQSVRSKLLDLFSTELAGCPGLTDGLVSDVCAYWNEKYGAVIASSESTADAVADAVDWLGNVAALFSGCFEDDMDFPAEDWRELKEAVSAEAVDMDMQTLSSVMTVFVSRGVL